MSEEDRLSPLGVGVARHHGSDMLRGSGPQRPREPIQRLQHLGAGLPHVEAEVGRHLVVAAAAGVELAAQRADSLCEQALDRHVHVLALLGQGRAALQRRGDPLQAGVDRGRLRRAEDARRAQRPRVGSAAGDVLTPEALVEGQRTKEPVDHRIRFLRQPAAARCRAQAFSFAARLASTSQGRPAIWAAGPQSCWLKLRLWSPRISGKNSAWSLRRDVMSTLPWKRSASMVPLTCFWVTAMKPSRADLSGLNQAPW